MNITIISNNYYPEDSGIGLYSTGMAEYLANKHIVKVISATPYYPQWKIYDGYKKKNSFNSEVINKVEIFRFKQYTPERPTFTGRILMMIHYFAGSLINIMKIKKNDVVVVVVPFTISVLLGWLLKTLKGGKLWIHVQDFEFDAAFETGLSSNRGILPKFIFKIEQFLFNRADIASTISLGMLKKLNLKTRSERVFFPNWIEHAKISPQKAKPPGIFNKSKFNILYSGNIGAKQDWDFFVAFVEAAGIIDKVHINLIGNGAKCKEVLKELERFSNVSYFPPVRYEDLNDILCSADLHILFQKNTVIDTVMPSKILGMMASAVPSLVTGHHESEVRTNFQTAACGYYVSDGDMDGILRHINYLIENPDIAQTMGENGRAFVITNFSYDKIMSSFQEKLESIGQNRIDDPIY